MKRKLFPRIQVSPHNDFVHTLVEANVQHYSQIEGHRTHNAIYASSVTAQLWIHSKTGAQCTCEQSFSLLTPTGDLTASGMNQVLSSAFGKPTFSSNDLEFTVADLHEDVEVEEADDVQMFSPLASKCGICYGTGFQRGFQPNGGYAYNLSSLNTDSPLITSAFPNKIKAGSDILLKHQHLALPYTLQVFDNLVALTAVITKHPEGFLVESAKDFTHLRVLYNTPLPIPVDFEQVQDKFQQELLGNTLEITAHLGTSSYVPQFSVFKDSKYNRYWQVTESTPHRLPNNNRILWWYCTCRLVQPHEIICNL